MPNADFANGSSRALNSLITTRVLKSRETNCWRTLLGRQGICDERRRALSRAQADGCQNFVQGGYKRGSQSYERGWHTRGRSLSLRRAFCEIFTPRYKRARRFLGGLNLLLAFNGVCKLYLKKGKIHERDFTQGERQESVERRIE